MMNILTALARAMLALTRRPRDGPAVAPPSYLRSRAPFLPLSHATHRDLGGGIRYALSVVGESFRQPALLALDGGRLQRGEPVLFTAALVLEPASPYDANAIRVEIRDGAHVGYLSRADAVRYHPVLVALAARQLIGVARAMLIGGVWPDKPTIGIVLDVNAPRTLLRALA
jgi:hypothetical protein